MRVLSQQEAGDYLQRGMVRVLGNPRLVKAVELLPLPAPDTTVYSAQPGMVLGQRYSHKRETQENPRGVWMLRKLRARHPSDDLAIHLTFLQSLLDCLNPAARRQFTAAVALEHFHETA